MESLRPIRRRNAVLDTRRRMRHALWIAILLTGGYTVLGARIFHLQVTTSGTYDEVDERRSRRPRHKIGRSNFERGRRGSIFDQRGQLLAASHDSWRVYVDQGATSYLPGTRRVWTLDEVSRRFCQLLIDLGVDFNESKLHRRIVRPLERKLPDGRIEKRRARSRFLIAGLDPSQHRHIDGILRNLRIRHFYFEAEETRNYPEGDTVSQIVGFVGRHADDRSPRAKGRAGIEMFLEKALAGRDGRFICESDGFRRELDLEGRWETLPRDGGDVGLTIDLRIQRIVREAMLEEAPKHRFRYATGLVLETATGRVLAAHSLPSFSPDSVGAGGFDIEQTRCRAIVDSYPPGSTFKPFVLARAIEDGKISWNDEFDTGPGTWKFGSRSIRDTKTLGRASIRDILVYSSNIGMSRLSQDVLGIEGLYRNLDSFRFRKSPGLCFPAQARGFYTSLKEAKRFPTSAPLSIPFGQEIQMSPLVLAAHFSIFGTGGIYHPPSLVNWIGSKSDALPASEESYRMLGARVADDTLGVLREVVDRGTADALKGLPWSVAAKTGTAQILGHPELRGTHAPALVALAPASRPRITASVVFYGAEGAVHYGNSVAGPPLRRIIERTLALLGEPADRAMVEERGR